MMHRMVYSCDVASLYITRSEYEKLSFSENIRLNMHLMGCEVCRRFKIQNTLISHQLEGLKSNPDKLKLAADRKEEIKMTMSDITKSGS